MMSTKWISAIVLLQLCYTGCGFCGKVLVWPCDMSPWLNIKIILEKLTERGHEVTVLVSPQSFIIDYNKPSTLKFEVIPMPHDREAAEKSLDHFLDIATNVMPTLSHWQSALKLDEFLFQDDGNFKLCETVVYNQSIMKKLREANYNVMVIDPALPCGELIAELLGVPFVYTFWIHQHDNPFWDQFYSEVLGRPTTLCEIMGKAEIWLIRTYWDFEFPRPYLPNFEFVGGLHCKPAKPLPKGMEEFVRSSGEDGVVVFSLGSMVKNLTDEKANLIASALAQIPQKVLWRYKGNKPATLGTNTRLYDWIPQNDLLGHPKTKAFITHGGTNGIYEAIYHGVPMVGVPLFADQPDNIAHMKAKGAAVEVNINTMTSADLLHALRTVINEPSYKENATRLSRIHHDQPVKPLDRAVFWIEFVMRHKGAKHLRPASHDLTWFQYHSLDVIGFLLACVATAIFLVTKCCLFCCRKFNKAGKKKKRE
ncbi:UDP-glucuronosyltransferase 2A3-like isoform X2 [Canis lupus dingo]|uniref:UDP-glucuronosyltransferase 2A3-like isoform X2 n=1 Tax=Canis lupus dingo TaxID=286419 RepID=UPI000DC66C33|nr:UDP-glucuronosyltransferase 2A3-like isoform X2 [Canis lupus dingo]